MLDHIYEANELNTNSNILYPYGFDIYALLYLYDLREILLEYAYKSIIQFAYKVLKSCMDYVLQSAFNAIYEIATHLMVYVSILDSHLCAEMNICN